MEALNELLIQVKAIEEGYSSKETFNAFRSIGVWNQERMHSKFIAEMLNPNGSHKMGDQFLKLFLKKIDYEQFYSSGARVGLEERAETRWIDLIIESQENDNVIVIENKLYAKDQNRQLADYYKFCMKKYRQVKMVYLTLDGKKPTRESVGDQDEDALKMEDVHCLSYEMHIVPWVDECAKLPTLRDRVKYALEMYSELVSDVINKNKYMDEIFEELKNDKKKLKLALDIKSALEGRNYLSDFPEVKHLLKDVFFNDFTEIINPYKNDDFPESIIDFDFNVPGIETLTGSLNLEKEEVYFTDHFGKIIPLFDGKACSNKLLQSLIMGDRETSYNEIHEALKRVKESNRI